MIFMYAFYRASSAGDKNPIMLASAAILATVILLALAGFQLALVAGVPLGHFAWGGQQRVLPVILRIFSLFAILMYALIASILLQKAALFSFWPESWIGIGIWIMTGYLALGIPLNAMSRSRPEQLVMTPAATILTILFLIVALS